MKKITTTAQAQLAEEVRNITFPFIGKRNVADKMTKALEAAGYETGAIYCRWNNGTSGTVKVTDGLVTLQVGCATGGKSYANYCPVVTVWRRAK